MEIKIKDNEIVVDGKTYVLKEESALPSEPEFNTPCWVIIDSAKVPAPIYVDGWEGTELTVADKKDCYVPPTTARLATRAEIELHLIKIAKEKGFVKGAKYLNTGGEHVVSIVATPKFFYSEDCDYLGIDSSAISPYIYDIVYDRGKWAEVLPFKKALPETRAEYELFIGEIEQSNILLPFGNMTTDEFLDQYDF